jgi:DNA-binding CsgD family transcriptional regulator
MTGQVFGREPEQRAVQEFLGRPEAGALVLAGPAGVGKTTLLQEAISIEIAREHTVLVTTPARGDMRLAFAGLADLLEGRFPDVAGELPAAQARALRVALLEEEARELPPEPRLIAAAFRSVLLRLADRGPVLVAIDDVQWLDSPSATMVGFAARRLTAEPVRLICGQRTEPGQDTFPLELDRAKLRPELLALGGLSAGALHRLLRTRLGVSFTRPVLHRIEDESGGNPLIALEIGRALAERGGSSARSTVLPVPATLHELVGHRLSLLASEVRSVLPLVAIMPGAALDIYLRSGIAESSLQAAVDAGVLEYDADRVRFTHPVLRSMVVAAMPASRLRKLHALAADLASGKEDRARHLALAADGPSDAVAGELETAAQSAIKRGAPATAGELLELAVALTPATDHEARARRAVQAGASHMIGGDHRASAVLEGVLGDLPPGAGRAHVLMQLSRTCFDSDGDRALALLEQARTDAAGNGAVTAELLQLLSELLARRGAHEDALRCAVDALGHAERACDPVLTARAIVGLSLLQMQAGYPADPELMAEAVAIERRIGSAALIWEGSPEYVGGYAALIDGRLDAAEKHWHRVLDYCDTENVEYWGPDLRMRLSLTAMCRGDLVAAAELAANGLELAEQLGDQHNVAALAWTCAEVAAQRGDLDGARDLAERGLREAQNVSTPTFRMRCEAVIALLDLAGGKFQAAAQQLGPLAVRWRAEAGRLLLPFGIEVYAVDALIRAGRIEQAQNLIDDMQASAYSPLGEALMARCRGQLAAARGDLNTALSALHRALELHDQISPQPIARGQVLLLLGSVLLRRKDRKAARDALLGAAACFEQVGARLWLPRVQSELARISGRPPASAELTTAERRVAELVAGGRTNKEAAAELFVSVRAVESNLTKAYAKLGVRSRTELAARLRAAGE